jgi:hypothetical protein
VNYDRRFVLVLAGVVRGNWLKGGSVSLAKSIGDFKSYGYNPFLTDALPFIKEKNAATRYISQDEVKMLQTGTGDVLPVYQVQVSRKHVDTQEFTKVYLDFLKEAINLRSSGQKVLLYIWDQKRKDEDTILFSLRDCLAHTGFTSRQSIYAGLAELLDKRFIARTEVHYKYYINPTLFFNGNRLRIVKEYIAPPRFRELPDNREASDS